MNGLFSNRYRLQKLAVAILLLMGLGAHTQFVGNRYAHQKLIILEKCLRAPTSCVDKPLVMRVRIKHSSDGSFIAYPKIRGEYRLVYPVPLSGDLTKIQHGYVIDILGLQDLEDESSSKLNDIMDLVIDIRKDARTQKNFEISDKIRDRLSEIKIQLKDEKDDKTSWTIIR